MLTILGPTLSNAAELLPATLTAWDQFTERAKARMNSRLDSRNHFLWVDEVSDRARRVRNGEILVTPANGSGQTEVPNGLIHDWIGAAFFPNMTLEQVFTTMDQYTCYKDFYKPLVIDSKLLSRDDKETNFSMRWFKKVLWTTTVMEGDYKATYFRRDEKSRYGFVWSTRIQDLVNYGQPLEQKLPPGSGSGFIWRLFSISRFQERDGGVYMELEAMALSRGIPTCMGWIVNPVIRRLSQSSLMTSLSETREAARSLPQRTGTDSCGSKSAKSKARSSE